MFFLKLLFILLIMLCPVAGLKVSLNISFRCHIYHINYCVNFVTCMLQVLCRHFAGGNMPKFCRIKVKIV